MDLVTDKVVLVTGGGAGIGRAAAFLFADGGARVIVTGRHSEPLRTLSQEHGNLDFVIADAANPEDASHTVSTVIERWGRLDVLVNNAGAGAILPLESATSSAITQMFAVNVFGPTLLAQAALPYLKATRGNIVNVSSTFGQKAAAALAEHRIRVNACCRASLRTSGSMVVWT